jgi:hypothetical protein
MPTALFARLQDDADMVFLRYEVSSLAAAVSSFFLSLEDMTRSSGEDVSD